MCRMLSIASKNEVPLKLFEDFQKLALIGRIKEDMTEQHQDGWGIAGYLGNWSVHFGRSEKGALRESENFIKAYKKAVISGTNILLAHLRKASLGDIVLQNSHPFIYKDWIFCHNGTVYDSQKLIVPGYTYEGTTDSEKLFKFLISRLEGRKIKDHTKILKDALCQVKKDCGFTSLTYLLSNGSYLIAAREYSQDEDYYTLFYSINDGSFIVCSEELPDYRWTAMKNGEILMINKYGGHYEI